MSKSKKNPVNISTGNIGEGRLADTHVGQPQGLFSLSESAKEFRQIQRYVGVSIGGGKSENTAIAIIDYYVKQNKAFVIDVFSHLGAENDSTADEVFIELMNEMAADAKVIAFDAPLNLPPCAQGCSLQCKKISACPKKEVQQMWHFFAKAKKENSRLKAFTPYSQRLVDLYYRYKYSNLEPFQDETMGANLAPKAVRMQFLLAKLQEQADALVKKEKLRKRPRTKTLRDEREFIEVWPKLALYSVANKIDLKPKEVLGYKNLEGGVQLRDRIVHELQERGELFIYERDIKKVVDSLPSFDALLCAWVALLAGQGRIQSEAKQYAEKFSWIHIPQI